MADSLNALTQETSRLASAWRDRVKPGDVFAFSGNDIPSTVVKVATQSHYVHVAIVVSVDPPNPEVDGILIAESHVDASLPSVGTGKKIIGVQFQWLSDRLKTQSTPVWWAPLKQPIRRDRLAVMRTWLRKIEQQQVPYDWVQAVGAGVETIVDVDLTPSADLRALFCSELVTHALQLAGVVNDAINASEQTPSDVMCYDCFEPPIQIHGQPILAATKDSQSS